MQVALDTFARSGIEGCSDGDLTAGVQEALRRFACLIESGCEPLAFPRFRLEEAIRTLAGLELEVEPGVRAALEKKAGELNGVSVEQLAAHAVLLYLAEMDREAEAES